MRSAFVGTCIALAPGAASAIGPILNPPDRGSPTHPAQGLVPSKTSPTFRHSYSGGLRPARTSSATFSHSFSGGTCVFDPALQRLNITMGRNRYASCMLNTPQFGPGRPGTYLGISCGQSRTLLFADSMIVVTLGRDAVVRGDVTLPGEALPAYNLRVDGHLGAPAVAYAADESGTYGFALGSNRMLVCANISTRANFTFDLSSSIEFPVGAGHGAHMHYTAGHVYVVQEGSSRIMELAIDMNGGQSSMATYTISRPCGSSPSFHESGGRLTIDFGGRRAVITPGVSATETR